MSVYVWKVLVGGGVNGSVGSTYADCIYKENRIQEDLYVIIIRQYNTTNPKYNTLPTNKDCCLGSVDTDPVPPSSNHS